MDKEQGAGADCMKQYAGKAADLMTRVISGELRIKLYPLNATIPESAERLVDWCIINGEFAMFYRGKAK